MFNIYPTISTKKSTKVKSNSYYNNNIKSVFYFDKVKLY